ncbi:MAG TPA: type II toxin-antitoxin system RelE/ParE family toxin [Blastocatellia bacterium]|nr:type II toxin-antitoxin system RelE/ParE family toxin [Blastocatellia bacterium]
MLPIKTSPAADRDIDEQYDFLVVNAGLDKAVLFLEAVEETFQRLSVMPKIGSRPEFASSRFRNLRWWPIKDFGSVLIFYVENKNYIYILRVLHRSRDIESILSSKN